MAFSPVKLSPDLPFYQRPIAQPLKIHCRT
jgi:hypothetical protein